MNRFASIVLKVFKAKDKITIIKINKASLFYVLASIKYGTNSNCHSPNFVVSFFTNRAPLYANLLKKKNYVLPTSSLTAK